MTIHGQHQVVESDSARSRHVVALILGCLLLLSGISLLLGGGGLALEHAFGRDHAGYFSTTVTGLQTPTAAIIDEDLPLRLEAGAPEWLLDTLDIKVRLQVAGPAGPAPLFVGIGPAPDVEASLSGVAHDQLVRLGRDGSSVLRRVPGNAAATAPTLQGFWLAQASRSASPELTWKATGGSVAVVLMNADGAPGLAVAHVRAGVRAGFLLPLALILIGVGVLLTGGGAGLLLRGTGRRGRMSGPVRRTSSPDVGFMVGTVGKGASRSPVSLNAQLDPGLSRWRWLVKWFLAVPHFLVLSLLWLAFFVVTVLAGCAILFTGRYPRSLFEFNLGVLRWSWRVSFYAASGGIGTDRYPPFTLGPAPGYPATLDIAYPARLSRGLVLVKWWLLAIPQYLIVGLLLNGWWGWSSVGGGGWRSDQGGGGILGLLVLITGIVLLFTGRYPRPLFDLIVGCNRWIYRVVAYAALMTDCYPPFRLDQGGAEPAPPRLDPDISTEPQVDLRLAQPAGRRP